MKKRTQGGEAMQDLDSMYKENAKMVYKFLLSLCREPDTAEELTQETFYQAIRCANKYDGTCKVSTWLCQIAKNLWLKELRRRRNKKAEPLTDPLLETLVSIEMNPEEQVLSAEKKMILFRKIHILDEISKEVLLLRITGTFSFREIGELFGKTENWARVTFYRAKQKVMKGVNDDEM
jgi:RNA polymerase sigma-70 factor (ECF subfamily)